MTDHRRGPSPVRPPLGEECRFYRALVDDQPDLVRRFLPDGTLTFVNRAYCTYFEKEREALLGSSFIPSIAPEDRNFVHERFSSLTKDRPVVTYEHRVVLSGGEVRRMRWTDRALPGDDGKIVEYQSIGRDVTSLETTGKPPENSSQARGKPVRERTGQPFKKGSAPKESHDAAGRSASWLQAFADSLPFVVFMMDTSGKYVMGNARSRMHYGDILGKRPEDLAPDGETLKRWQRNNEKAFAGKTAKGRIDFPVRGEMKNFFNIVSPVYSEDRIIGISGVNIEITALIRSEKKAQEIRLREKAVLDNIPDMVWVKDKDAKFITVNEAYAKACGHRTEELVGRTDIDMWPKFFLAERYREDDFAVIRSGKRKTIEETIVGPDGRERWIEAVKSPLYDRDHNLVGLVGIARDITERKKASDEIRESRDKLKQTLCGIIKAIGTIVEVRDPYTSGHQRRVAEISRGIAQKINLSPNDIQGIYIAALIHDLGKIAVPSEILSKPSSLSRAESELIHAHSRIGYDITERINFPWNVAEIIYQHHERIDGSGYPRGLKGDEIILGAKILAVADVVEAMASHRPYRPALGVELAVKEIMQYRNILYDGAVVDACLDLLREKDFQSFDVIREFEL